MTTKIEERLHLPMDAIGEFCRRHHICKLAIFGSALTDRFRPDSDVDILAEFEPGKAPGFTFSAMEEELAQILGRDVDLLTLGFLRPRIRDRVKAQAEVFYSN